MSKIYFNVNASGDKQTDNEQVPEKNETAPITDESASLMPEKEEKAEQKRKDIKLTGKVRPRAPKKKEESPEKPKDEPMTELNPAKSRSPQPEKTEEKPVDINDTLSEDTQPKQVYTGRIKPRTKKTAASSDEEKTVEDKQEENSVEDKSQDGTDIAPSETSQESSRDELEEKKKTARKSSSKKKKTEDVAADMAPETKSVPLAEEQTGAAGEDGARKQHNSGIQMAMFSGDENSTDEPEHINNFDKQKIFKSFKKRRKPINYKVDRFSPKLNEGLTPDEVETRFTQYLFNDTRKDQSKSYLSIFVSNICTFFNLLCLLAAIALIISGVSKISSYLVVIVTFANICLGIIWEIRSKLALNKLSILSEKTCKVIRDGETIEIPIKEVVLDDILYLELGNQVPVDCILAEGSVEVNEALLTGESVSIKKNIGDMLYAGSFISSGTGKFRVEKVGENTYLQKLTTKAKKYKKPNSELMNSTKLIIKVIAILIIPIAIGIFFTSKKSYDPTSAAMWVKDFIFNGQINYAIQRAATVVIGMIPSGMLLLTSLALSLGVIRLAKQNTLVQDLYSLEMLARVNVLCLDKTGTITDGRMQVKDVIILNTIDNCPLDDIMGSMLKALEDNNQTFIALYNHFGHSSTLTPKECIHFSSKRKLSAVTFEDVGTFCMGAPEFVLKPYPAKVERLVKQYAQMGLRVLVVAHSPAPIIGDKLPPIMKPVAVISIADNIREDAITTLKWFKDNDVAIKVISGDNPITVAEVAKRAGVENADKYISLEGFNDKEIESVANKYNVFGRVTPEQKAVLIRAIKADGNTVAMTGDGVNDILAMKESDCAIGLASGSDAATNVSHLVLMDSNFNSMPKIVSEGRRVINNIKNSSTMYLMKTFFTTLLAAICIIMGHSYLFTTDNLILLEILVIGVPTFFLSLQPNNARVQGKFMTHVLTRAIAGALVIVICVMAMYLLGNSDPGFGLFPEHCIAMCMLVLTFSGFVMLFRVCQPFNAYRFIMFIGVVALAIVCLTVSPITEMLYSGWSDLKWDYEKIITVVVIVEAAFALSSFALRGLESLFPGAFGQKQEKEKK